MTLKRQKESLPQEGSVLLGCRMTCLRFHDANNFLCQQKRQKRRNAMQADIISEFKSTSTSFKRST